MHDHDGNETGKNLRGAFYLQALKFVTDSGIIKDQDDQTDLEAPNGKHLTKVIVLVVVKPHFQLLKGHFFWRFRGILVIFFLINGRLVVNGCFILIDGIVSHSLWPSLSRCFNHCVDCTLSFLSSRLEMVDVFRMH